MWMTDMVCDQLRNVVTRVEADVASGPIVPMVTPQEIRSYLASHYDFARPLALEDVCADVERMLRTWQDSGAGRSA